MKPFSAEGRFECGMDALVEGKVWAFVPVIGHNYPAALGIAVANEPGYYPIPEFWCYGDCWDQMAQHADQLNAAEGKDRKSAAVIVASTMRKIPPRV